MISDENLVFYITHYCKDASDEILIHHSVKSVQHFYPTSDIVICRSPSDYVSTIYDTFTNVLLIENPLPNSLTCGAIKDFIQRYAGSSKMLITLHDSIFLKGRFNEDRLQSGFGFLWYFPSFLCHPDNICTPEIRFHYVQLMNSEPFMDIGSFPGCFGACIFGTYSEVERFWNSAPFEEYLEMGPKKGVIQDLERLFAVVAFKYGFVRDTDSCSLCGMIYRFKHAFQEWFTRQSLEEIYALDYKEACVKVWKQRFMKS